MPRADPDPVGWRPDPELVAAAAQLPLVAGRRLMRPGPGGGRLAAAGGGADFLEHSGYRPGDELRQVDWRASARRGRPIVRRMQEDAACRVELVVDASGSMAYGGGNASKLDLARSLAATVARAALASGNAVGLRAVGGAAEPQPPMAARGGPRQWPRALAFLGSLAAGGDAGWAAHLAALRRAGGPPAWTWLVGDWADPAAAGLGSALARLVGDGHRLSMVELRADNEDRLQFAAALVLANMEGAGELPLDPKDRPDAVRAVAAHRRATAAMFAAAGVWSHTVYPVGAPAAALLGTLRQAMRPMAPASPPGGAAPGRVA